MWLRAPDLLLQSLMPVRCLQSAIIVSSNQSAGGIGVIGGVRQSPKFLQNSIAELKAHLEDKSAPFGVDLLIPQVGGSARKTNVNPA